MLFIALIAASIFYELFYSSFEHAEDDNDDNHYKEEEGNNRDNDYSTFYPGQMAKTSSMVLAPTISQQNMISNHRRLSSADKEQHRQTASVSHSIAVGSRDNSISSNHDDGIDNHLQQQDDQADDDDEAAA